MKRGKGNREKEKEKRSRRGKKKELGRGGEGERGGINGLSTHPLVNPLSKIPRSPPKPKSDDHINFKIPHGIKLFLFTTGLLAF